MSAVEDVGGHHEKFAHYAKTNGKSPDGFKQDGRVLRK
jgi:hypothetical protein